MEKPTWGLDWEGNEIFISKKLLSIGSTASVFIDKASFTDQLEKQVTFA